MSRLPLRHQCEEITLVLVRIGAAKDGRGAIALRSTTSIVAGGDLFESLRKCVIEKHAELHFAVAPHIRVGRDAGAVAFDEVVDNAFAVGVDEVDDAQLDAEVFRDRLRVLDVFFPRTIAGNALGVDPIFHVARGDLVALLDQQCGGDRAIDAAGETDQDLCHARGF